MAELETSLGPFRDGQPDKPCLPSLLKAGAGTTEWVNFHLQPFPLYCLDMSEEKIQVIAYSGYRGEETPRTILLHGERIEVIEILERWIEERSEGRSRKRFFKIKGSDGAIHLIYYDERVMEWVYIVKD